MRQSLPALLAQLFVLVALAVLPALPTVAQSADELQEAALNVQVGREIVRTFLRACEESYRARGFDAQFAQFFWDTLRFDVLEGARIVRGTNDASDQLRGVEIPSGSPSFERCAYVVRENVRQKQPFPMATEDDVRKMQAVFRASNPDPQIGRNKSLLNDCMKSQFNARQLNFSLARVRCDCTVTAMNSVGSEELDLWMKRSQAGDDAPMWSQPWFPSVFPKIQSCLQQE